MTSAIYENQHTVLLIVEAQTGRGGISKGPRFFEAKIAVFAWCG